MNNINFIDCSIDQKKQLEIILKDNPDAWKLVSFAKSLDYRTGFESVDFSPLEISVIEKSLDSDSLQTHLIQQFKCLLKEWEDSGQIKIQNGYLIPIPTGTSEGVPYIERSFAEPRFFEFMKK